MEVQEKSLKKTADVEINLVPLLKYLLKKIWIIVLAGFLIACIAFGVTKLFVKPLYRSSFTAYVNNQQVQANKDYLSSSDLTAAKELVRTYAQILKSRTVLTKASENLSLDYSYEKLSNMVSSEIQNETEIITVYVVHQDPNTAYTLSNEIAKIAPEYMSDIVEGSSMKVIDYPEYTNKRYKPSYSRYALLGFVVGMLLMAVVLLIRYFSDDTIHSESEVESRFGIPILGVIPDALAERSRNSDYYYYSDYNSPRRENASKKGDK